MKRGMVVLVTLLMLLSPAVPRLAPARAQDDENPGDYPRAEMDADAVRPGVALIGDGTDWYIVTLADASVDPGAVADELAASDGLVIGHVYRYALRGFSAMIPAAVLPDIRQNPLVARIVPISAGTTTGGGGATSESQADSSGTCAKGKAKTQQGGRAPQGQSARHDGRSTHAARAKHGKASCKSGRH